MSNFDTEKTRNLMNPPVVNQQSVIQIHTYLEKYSRPFVIIEN